MDHKKQVIHAFLHIVNTKVEELERDIESLNESKVGEQKSSAGDKFETSREMMRQQEALIEQQLSQLRKHRQNLKSAAENRSKSVAFGAYMVTSSGSYLFVGGIGSVEVNGVTIHAVSMQSPIGMAFTASETGDTVLWRNQSVEVLEVQ